MNIEEIKAREQDARCGEIGAVSDSQHDVKSLIAEAERLTAEVECLDNEYHHYRRLSEEADQQIATLKKTLELACAELAGESCPNECYECPHNCSKMCLGEESEATKCWNERFMKQAQQLTHETHGVEK